MKIVEVRSEKNKVDRGEFLPYINGRYVNPHAKSEKVTIIRSREKKKELLF